MPTATQESTIKNATLLFTLTQYEQQFIHIGALEPTSLATYP